MQCVATTALQNHVRDNRQKWDSLYILEKSLLASVGVFFFCK